MGLVERPDHELRELGVGAAAERDQLQLGAAVRQQRAMVREHDFHVYLLWSDRVERCGTGGSGPGPWAQYILGVDVADTTPPQITAVSPLPGNNGSTNGVVDTLTLSLSKDLDATTVTSSNFDLREAGPDGLFGTADDVVYSLGVNSYTSGLSVVLPIQDGPLGNGHYRFTATSGLLDRSGNQLGGGSGYVQFFTVALPSGFVFEGRNNGTQATATSLSTSPQATGDGSFTVLSSQIAGSGSCSLATGDFNGDGKADLVLGNTSASNVTVLLSNGDGTFGSGTNYATGTSTYAVAVGDLNGDGKLDLVTANPGGNYVSVLLGNGNGIFGSAAIYAVGNSPYSVALGDLNGDGKLDLVTANYGGNNVSVLLGNGNGTFGSAVNYAVGTNPRWVALGDLNGDGKLDLVTANSGGNNVSVLLGNGSGTFGSAVNYAVGTNPQSVALGDLNGDGKLDMVTANYGSNNVSLLLGNGSGAFGSVVNYAVGSNPCSVVVRDINGDGRGDAMAANYNSGSLSVLLGNSDGSLQSAVNYSSVGSAQAVAAGDFNGDGRMDLAVVSCYSSSTVTALLSNNAKPLTEDPVGSGLWMGRGIGSIQTTSDVDYWSFTALAGDVVSVSVDRYQNTTLSPGVSLYSASGNYGASDWQGGPNGGAFLSHYTIPTGGTYYINVNQGNGTTARTRCTSKWRRGIQQESDRAYANDSISGANALTSAHGASGHWVATVAGTNMSATDKDMYLLGTLSTGNVVTLTMQLPSSSSWNGIVTVVDASGTPVADTDGNLVDDHFQGTIPANGAYYAKVLPVWSYNSHAYVVTQSSMTWTAAEAYAQNVGRSLGNGQ